VRTIAAYPPSERWTLNQYPSVSVVVPTRDRPALLRRAVQSVLNQTYPGRIECFVVFDRSTPEHPVVEVPQGRTVRILANQRAAGLAGSRNTGVEASAGELIAFCDDDDAWHPQKLEEQVRALRSHPSWTAVACGIVVEYDHRAIVRVPPRSEVTLPDLVRSRVMEVNASTVVARRSDFFGLVGAVDESIPGGYAEDYEWLLRVARLGPIGVVRRALVRIRWHAGSWFARRWETIADALAYLLDKHPELHRDARGFARISGQIAFAHAAAGNATEARRWALRTMRSNWRERRAYIAVAVSTGFLDPHTVTRLARSAGKGI
jgi:glycosyltransferase involved in cell wall biosynthesis